MDAVAVQCCVLTPWESVYSLLCAGSEGVVKSPVPLFWVATGSALLDLGLHINMQCHAGLAHLQRVRKCAKRYVDVVLRGRWARSGLEAMVCPSDCEFMLVLEVINEIINAISQCAEPSW